MIPIPKNTTEVLQVTKQKRLILDLVESSHEHPTAEEIFFRARQQMPSIALGTVYRNLNALVEDGMVRRITIPGEADRFDNTHRHHDHMICSCCGAIKDVYICGIEEAIKKATGDEVSFYELNAYYVCEKCKGITAATAI